MGFSGAWRIEIEPRWLPPLTDQIYLLRSRRVGLVRSPPLAALRRSLGFVLVRFCRGGRRLCLGISQSLGSLFHAGQHVDRRSRGVGANVAGIEILTRCLRRGANLRNLFDQMLDRLPYGCPGGGRGSAPSHGTLRTGDVAGKYLRHNDSPGGPAHTMIQTGHLARVGKCAVSGCSLLIGIPNAFL